VGGGNVQCDSERLSVEAIRQRVGGCAWGEGEAM
jgi:hypothetical protein